MFFVIVTSLLTPSPLVGEGWGEGALPTALLTLGSAR